MIPFKSTNFLRQYNPNKNHKWGFKIWERSGIRGILYDFEVYPCQSNNKETRFGVSGDAVDKLASTLPENENYKIFADNFLTNLLLIAHLNSKGIWYVGTASLARLKTCPLMANKDLKKKDRGSFDHCFEENRGIIVVNKAIHIVSSYARRPLMLRGATISIKQHVQVFPYKIVRIYNKFVGGTDKLDIIVQYTSPHYHLEDVRYLSLHSVVIAIVNAWFLFRRNTK